MREALPRVCAALRKLGAEVLLPGEGDAFPSPNADALIRESDVTVALGGDGTIIHTAKRAAICGRAVLGINGGRLGFMAGLEADELERLSALIRGEYTVEKRMLLDIVVQTGEGGGTRYSALNEAVVSRGSLSRMIELEVSNRGERVARYRADGVIVATPTGSTAYSLSAGGPVIDPALRCLLLTPVCPHSLHSRSYLFDEDAVLAVRPAGGAGRADLSDRGRGRSGAARAGGRGTPLPGRIGGLPDHAGAQALLRGAQPEADEPLTERQ